MKQWIQYLALGTSLISAQSSWALHPALERTIERIRADVAQGHSAFVISDLDETLIDSNARRFYSLRRATLEHCGESREGSCGLLLGINLIETFQLSNRYDYTPLFEGINIGRDIYQALWERSFEYYLSNDFMKLDQAIPGAVEFTQRLREAGAELFYVSSRWASRQKTGTWANLRELGLLLRGEEGHVYLRNDGETSIDFKRSTFEQLKRLAQKNHASIRLVMENEPENFNAMAETFPDADRVFVEGAWLKQEPLKAQAIRIRDFR